MLSRHVITVGGRDFGLSETNYNKIKHAVCPDSPSCPIIDRDPQIFADYIWPYLIGYTIYLKETRKETLWRIWSDAQYYQLPELAQLVQAELGPSITMTPEQKEEAIQEEIKVIKQTFTSFANLIGASFGHRLGLADLGTKIVAELEEFNDQIRECAIDSVENGGDFFNLNPKQKLIMAVGTSIYFKLFSTINDARGGGGNGPVVEHPPDDFMNDAEIDEAAAEGYQVGPRQFPIRGDYWIRRPMYFNNNDNNNDHAIPIPHYINLGRVPVGEPEPRQFSPGPDGGRAQEVAEELEEHLHNIIVPDPGPVELNVNTDTNDLDVETVDTIDLDCVKLVEPNPFTEINAVDIETVVAPDIEAVKTVGHVIFSDNIGN